MFLVLPDVKYKDSVIAAYVEDPEMSEELALAEKDFSAFVEQVSGKSKGLGLKEGSVPYTRYWLIDGNEFVGHVRIRHYLNEELEKHGGHIGYWIRPSKRKMGYGKKILGLALEKAKEMGLDKIQIRCDANNTGSRKIIESNGGVFQKSEVIDKAEVLYYLIQL